MQCSEGVKSEPAFPISELVSEVSLLFYNERHSLQLLLKDTYFGGNSRQQLCLQMTSFLSSLLENWSMLKVKYRQNADLIKTKKQRAKEQKQNKRAKFKFRYLVIMLKYTAYTALHFFLTWLYCQKRYKALCYFQDAVLPLLKLMYEGNKPMLTQF